MLSMQPFKKIPMCSKFTALIALSSLSSVQALVANTNTAVESCNHKFPIQGCGGACMFPCPSGFYCTTASDCAAPLACYEGMCDSASDYLPSYVYVSTQSTTSTKRIGTSATLSMAVATQTSMPSTGIAYGALGSPCVASTQCSAALVCYSQTCQSTWTQPAFLNSSTYFDTQWNILKYAYGKFNQKLAVDPITGCGNVLSVFYPKGTCNPGMKPVGGTGLYALPMDLSKASIVTLEYSVNFQAGFDWVLGGKLPGLYGGGPGCTGGSLALNCYSARFMWRAGGMGEVYLYVDNALQTIDFCSQVPNTFCNPSYGVSLARGSFMFSTTAWTGIKESVQMNTFKADGTPNQDGVLTVWINGGVTPVIRMHSLVFAPMQSAITVGIDFETFFGGSQPSFYNSKDQYAYFKDFKLYAQ